MEVLRFCQVMPQTLAGGSRAGFLSVVLTLPFPRPKPQHLVNHLVCLAPELLHWNPGVGARGPLNRCPGCADQNVGRSPNSAPQKPLGLGPTSGPIVRLHGLVYRRPRSLLVE